MKTIPTAAIGAAFLLSFAIAPGHAQEPQPLQCAPRGEIIRALGSAYGEHLLVQAPMDDGRLLEIYVADDRRYDAFLDPALASPDYAVVRTPAGTASPLLPTPDVTG